MSAGGYVVVTFGSKADDWCTLNKCPMQAYGPFGTHEQAYAYAGTCPEWQEPHILILEGSDE
jgi:hypothetical protein